MKTIMKNIMKTGVCIVLILAMALGCCGCRRTTDYEEKYADLISGFSPNDFNVEKLIVGETDKPTAAVWARNIPFQRVEIVSADESVVTVDKSGKVTAVGAGSAYVIFQVYHFRFIRGVNRIYRYDVYNDVFEKNMDAGYETVTMHIGQQQCLSGLGSMSGKCYSSDESVVAVSKDGKVTAVGIGTAYIVYEFSSIHSEMYRCMVVQERNTVTFE